MSDTPVPLQIVDAHRPNHASCNGRMLRAEAVRAAELSPVQLLLKRCLDIALAVPLLILCAPLLVLIWLRVRCSSPGPALYRQSRIGFRGKQFVMFKFRSMVAAAEDTHREYTQAWIQDGERARQVNGEFKIHKDGRITRFGRFLRKYSLDELPQLLNVVKGEMSLVGPRPAMSYEVAAYEPWHTQRLLARPGITGLWQVSGRNRLTFERMVELDVEYIRTWSLLRDIQILLRTVPVVLLGTGH